MRTREQQLQEDLRSIAVRHLVRERAHDAEIAPLARAPHGAAGPPACRVCLHYVVTVWSCLFFGVLIGKGEDERGVRAC